MRSKWTVGVIFALGIGVCLGQDAAPAPAPGQTAAPPATEKIFSVGPGVTAPELLPPTPLLIRTEECHKKVDGTVALAFYVDPAGAPRNIAYARVMGNGLDLLAMRIVAADRFKPGTHDGQPVAVGQQVEVKIQSCVDERRDDAGKKAYAWRLRAVPEQELSSVTDGAGDQRQPWGSDSQAKAFPGLYRVGGGVSPPVPLNSVEAEFSDEARKAKYQGTCLVSMIVDAQGMPQNPRVIRALGMGLDQKAIQAVKKYRFRPAMKGTAPVPVLITVEVNFRLYPKW